MANLYEIYPEQIAPKLAKKGINLFEIYGEPEQEQITDPMELAHQQIKQQYPDMPDWLREGILKMTPQQQNPMLQSAAKGITDVSNYIPAVAGGLAQGASLPIRGVAGLIPTEFTQRLANSPDLRSFFPKPESEGQHAAQLGGELVGAGGLLGKLFQGAQGLNAAAKVPQALQAPLALAETGYVGTPGDVSDRSLGAGAGVALGGLGKVAGKAVDKVPDVIKGLFNKSTPESIVKAVQKPHDLLLLIHLLNQWPVVTEQISYHLHSCEK